MSYATKAVQGVDNRLNLVDQLFQHIEPFFGGLPFFTFLPPFQSIGIRTLFLLPHESGGEFADDDPDPWPPGTRVQVALSKKRVRMGTRLRKAALKICSLTSIGFLLLTTDADTRRAARKSSPFSSSFFKQETQWPTAAVPH
jgi:hypothetical protein